MGCWAATFPSMALALARSDGRELFQNMTKTDPFSVVFQNICRGGQGLLNFDEISIALHRFGLRSSTHLTPKASTKFQAAQTGS
jgi:Ca2+-binding EF-hand superfamily protein